jgi:pyrroline-5-carboxylate reductase
LEWAGQLFGAVGSVHHVPEAALDAVTAVSGSGPAYVYYFAELLIEAAKAAGLGPLLAHALAIETLAGAAAMLNQPGADPAVLKARVASPRGTTEAGLAAMTDLGMGNAVHAAVRTAAARSREISAVFAQPVAGQVQGN